MVAGCRLWGEDEQRAAQHHARCRRDLGVEAVGQDGIGAGEAGQLGRGVETRRPVDEQDHREAQPAEQEYRPAEAGPPPSGRENRDGRDQQGDRDQQIGVGVDRGFEADFGGARDPGQAGVPGLAHLDAAVVDELRGDQAGGRGDDHAADRPLGGHDPAGAGRLPRRPAGGTPGQAIGKAEDAQQENRQGPQPPPGPTQKATGAGVEGLPPAGQALRPALPDAADVPNGAEEQRLGRPQPAIDAAIDPARPADEQGGRRSSAAPFGRCYYSASLSPPLFHGLPRARKGLFLAPIPVFAGRPVFRSLPLHDNPFTLRPCHVASL